MRNKLIIGLCILMLCGCSVSKRKPHDEIAKLGYNEDSALHFENVQSSRIACGAGTKIQFAGEEYTKVCDQQSCLYVKKEGKEFSFVLETNQEVVKNDRFAVMWENYHEHETVIMAEHTRDWTLTFDLTTMAPTEMKNEVIKIVLRTVDKTDKFIDTTYTILLNEENGLLNVEFTESTEIL